MLAWARGRGGHAEGHKGPGGNGHAAAVGAGYGGWLCGGGGQPAQEEGYDLHGAASFVVAQIVPTPMWRAMAS